VCDDGVCILARCGNGVVETFYEDDADDEFCDDGNQDDGDGCSSNCKSLEACGDGVRDLIAGEECDDGNDFDRDGCNRLCASTPAFWRPLDRVLPVRHRYAGAYDPHRERVLVFGGTSELGNDLGDTWEWDGESWNPVSLSGPPPRSAPTMAYDGARRESVLFGSVTDVINDTWVFNGLVWSQRFPVASPPATSRPALAYDSAREVVTLVSP